MMQFLIELSRWVLIYIVDTHATFEQNKIRKRQNNIFNAMWWVHSIRMNIIYLRKNELFLKFIYVKWWKSCWHIAKNSLHSCCNKIWIVILENEWNITRFHLFLWIERIRFEMTCIWYFFFCYNTFRFFFFVSSHREWNVAVMKNANNFRSFFFVMCRIPFAMILYIALAFCLLCNIQISTMSVLHLVIIMEFIPMTCDQNIWNDALDRM